MKKYLTRKLIINTPGILCLPYFPLQKSPQRRERAPDLSEEEYTIVLATLSSHGRFKQGSHKEKLLYRKVGLSVWFHFVSKKIEVVL